MCIVSEHSTAYELGEVILTTANGLPYTNRDACELAHALWGRFGRDYEAGVQAWRRLLEDDTPIADFERLVRAYLFTFVSERMEENDASFRSSDG